MIHGRHLIVSVGGIAVGAAKSCTIDAQAEMIETASASQGNYREYRSGRSEWSVNITHLVTPTNATNVLHTGVQVALSWIPLLPGKTLPFDGFVDGVTIEPIGLPPGVELAGIYYDSDGEYFVALYNNKYYRYWADGQDYMTPSDSTNFDDGADQIWYWNGTTLVANQRIGGNALVQRVRLSATVGMLAQGQVQFQGSGELAAVNP